MTAVELSPALLLVTLAPLLSHTWYTSRMLPTQSCRGVNVKSPAAYTVRLPTPSICSSSPRSRNAPRLAPLLFWTWYCPHRNCVPLYLSCGRVDKGWVGEGQQ